MLVIDTNILLSSVAEFSSFVKSGRWTVFVPLPVIIELDSQSSNTSPEATTAALRYITSHVKSRAISLKVLTSRGNYLSNIDVRTEQVDLPATCGSATPVISSSALPSGRVSTGRIVPRYLAATTRLDRVCLRLQRSCCSALTACVSSLLPYCTSVCI